MPRGSIHDSLANVEAESSEEDSSEATTSEPEKSTEEESQLAPEGEAAGDSTDAVEEDQSTDSPSIDDRLRQFGFSDSELDLGDVPQDVVEKILDKAEERVKGFQSNVTRKEQTLGAKAQAYDQIASNPAFQSWLEEYKAGEWKPRDSEQDLSEVEDPYERFNILVERAVNDRLSGLEERLGAISGALGQQGWQAFVRQNPDAQDMGEDIAFAMNEYGMDVDQAYKYVRALSFDPDSERDRLKRELAEKKSVSTAQKKRAGATFKKSGSKGEEKSEDILQIGREKGRRAAFFAALENAEKEVFGT